MTKKKEQENTVESGILNKLEAMEKRIHAIESSLKRIDEHSILTTEDQLFFGIVFTLLILFLQLPEFDVCTIFESFGVVVEPTKAIITTKMVLVILLMLSGGARYLTALIKRDSKRNKWRMVSVSFLIASLYFLILDLTIRGLAAALISINVFLIFLSPLTLSVIAVPIGFLLERKWYRAYGYDQAFVSTIFGLMGLIVVVAYYVGMIASLFIPITDLVVTIILFASIFIVYLINRLSTSLYKRLRGNKSSQRTMWFGMTQVKDKIRRLLMSKWFWYVLIALMLVVGVYVILPRLVLRGLVSLELALNIYAEAWGLFFTLLIFIVLLDLRKWAEWKSVEGRVKQRIGRLIRELFASLLIFCVVEREHFDSKKKRVELVERQLKTLASGEIGLTTEAKKDLLGKDLRLRYEMDLHSIANNLGRIDVRFSDRLDPELRESLIDIQNYLHKLSLEFRVRHTSDEDYFKSLSNLFGKIMKEILKFKRKGIWVNW